MKAFKAFIKGYIKELTGKDLGPYAASSTFFLFLSLIPILILLTLLLPHIGVGQEELIQIVDEFTPDFIHGTLAQIIREAFSKSGSGLLPLTLVLLIWSAGKGLAALQRGLALAYEETFSQNYVIFRLAAILYTLILMVYLTVAMLLMVFGERIVEKSFLHEVELPHVLKTLFHSRHIIGVFLGFLFVLLLYRFCSGCHEKITVHLPGAALVVIAWAIFTGLFSVYLKNNNTYDTIYGSLATLVVMQIWLYFCVCILILGASINHYLMKRKEAKSVEHGEETSVS